jgi:hypothetical protein
MQSRIAQITWGLGSYFTCLAYDRLTGTEDSPETVKRRAQQLRETLTDLGPSFIKAGQVLANRPDIVREDYMNELCVLQVRFWGRGQQGRQRGGCVAAAAEAAGQQVTEHSRASRVCVGCVLQVRCSSTDSVAQLWG